MNSHDTIITKSGYPKQIGEMFVYHKNVHRHTTNQICQHQIYTLHNRQGYDPEMWLPPYPELEGEAVFINF